ncbi:hypothetical protein QOT17_018494 [Balamuthia mandrillaris]
MADIPTFCLLATLCALQEGPAPSLDMSLVAPGVYTTRTASTSVTRAFHAQFALGPFEDGAEDDYVIGVRRTTAVKVASRPYNGCNPSTNDAYQENVQCEATAQTESIFFPLDLSGYVSGTAEDVIGINSPYVIHTQGSASTATMDLFWTRISKDKSYVAAPAGTHNFVDESLDVYVYLIGPDDDEVTIPWAAAAVGTSLRQEERNRMVQLVADEDNVVISHDLSSSNPLRLTVSSSVAQTVHLTAIYAPTGRELGELELVFLDPASPLVTQVFPRSAQLKAGSKLGRLDRLDDEDTTQTGTSFDSSLRVRFTPETNAGGLPFDINLNFDVSAYRQLTVLDAELHINFFNRNPNRVWFFALRRFDQGDDRSGWVPIGSTDQAEKGVWELFSLDSAVMVNGQFRHGGNTYNVDSLSELISPEGLVRLRVYTNRDSSHNSPLHLDLVELVLTVGEER